MKTIKVSDPLIETFEIPDTLSRIDEQQNLIDLLLNALTDGDALPDEPAQATLGGLDKVKRLKEDVALNFLCTTLQGENTTENREGKSNVHRFDLGSHSLWSKPDPIGRNHVDPATAAWVELLYLVLSKKRMCTFTKAVKVSAGKAQRACLSSVGIEGISFRDAILLKDDFSAYIKEFGEQKLADIINNWSDAEYRQRTCAEFKSIAQNTFFEKHVKYFSKLFPGAATPETVRAASSLLQFLDWQAASTMFILHLLARVNDAKADNMMLEIHHDNASGKLELHVVDIDFDLADANPHYVNKKTHYEKVDGEDERKKVTEEHHYTGLKSLLFILPEILDRPIHPITREELTERHAIFSTLDWLQLVYERDVHYQQQIDGNIFVHQDLNEDDQPSMILLQKFSIGMVQILYNDLLTIQNLITDKSLTHRQLFAALHKIAAALYEYFEKNIPNSLGALRKIYGGESVEEAITHHDIGHPLTAELKSQNCPTYENNNDERKASSREEITTFIGGFPIMSLPTLKDQLLFLNQVATAFPFIVSLQLDQKQRDELLYHAVKNALPGATALLIKLGADVNQSHRKQPLLHMLLENYHKHDFATRVLPTLNQLTSCSRIKINLQNADGDTPTMVFCQNVALGANKETVETQNALKIFTDLSCHGATLIPTNNEGLHAFDLAYKLWSDTGNPDLCFALVEKFRGRKFNTVDAHKSIETFIATYYGDIDTSDADNKLLVECIHTNTELSFKRVLAQISSDKKEGSDWIKIEGSDSGVRYLNPKYASHIFDEKGHIKNDEAFYGRRSINRIFTENNEGIFFKEAAELPTCEYSVYLFRNMMINHGAAYTEVFRFTDKSGVEFDVQLSSRLHGTVLQDNKSSKSASKESVSDLDNIDHYSFSGMAMCSMFLNPEDDKPDNIIDIHFYDALGIKRFLLGGFDNDHHYVDGVGVTRQFLGQPKLMVKSFIYCLDQMKQPLDPLFVSEFLEKNPTLFLERWLLALQQRYERNNNLFKQSKKAFPIPFSQKVIDQIHRKFYKAQEVLKKNPQTPAIDILKILEPQVGVRYEAALNKFRNPYTRFAEITDQLYKKDATKKNSYLTQIGSSDILESQGIPFVITTDVREADKFSPKQALEYLTILSSKDQIIKQIHQEFRNGNISGFEQVQFDTIREEIISTFDFGTISDAHQKTIIRSLLKKPVKFNNLRIKNCGALVDGDVKALLQTCEHLKSINLSGCKRLTNNVVSLIDNSDKCDVLDRLVLNETNITDLTISNLRNIRKVLACNCDFLTNVEINNQTFKHLVLRNNRLLENLSFDARQLRTVDVRGCPKLSNDSLSMVVSSSTLENMKLDDSHLRFNKRYLTAQAVKHHQWNSKIIATIIEDNTLDLSGFSAITDADLEKIAEVSRDKIVPQVRVLKLNGYEAPVRGLRKFILEHPECEQVQFNGVISRDLNQTQKMSKHFPKARNPFRLVTFNTGEIIRFDESNIVIQDALLNEIKTLTLNDFNEKRVLATVRGAKIKSLKQLKCGDWLVVTDNQIMLINGITYKKISTIDIKEKITRRLRTQLSKWDNSSVQISQLNDNLAVVAISDKRSGKSVLYLANTQTNLLKPIKLPEGCVTNIQQCVLNQNELVLASENFIQYFNVESNRVTNTVKLTETVKQVALLNTNELVALHDDCISFINTRKKKPTPSKIKITNSAALKGFVLLPKHYLVTYDDQNAYVVNLQDRQQEVIKLELPPHKQITEMAVDSSGKLICSLITDSGSSIHSVSITNATLDLSTFRKYLSQVDILPFQKKLYITSPFLGDDAAKAAFIDHLANLFPVAIKPCRISDRAYLEINATDHCSVGEICSFISEWSSQQSSANADSKIIDLRGILLDEDDLRYFVRNSRHITQLHNIEPSTLTTATLSFLVSNHPGLTQISLSKDSFSRGLGSRLLSPRRDSASKVNTRPIQFQNSNGQEILIENVPESRYQLLCRAIQSIPGCSLIDVIPPVQKNVVAKKPLPTAPKTPPKPQTPLKKGWVASKGPKLFDMGRGRAVKKPEDGGKTASLNFGGDDE